MSKPTMMIILAHPDDESFPMGGTIAKAASEGVRVVLVCATRGEAGIPNRPHSQAGEIRSSELLCAAEKLGIQEIHFLEYQDGDLAQADPEEIMGRLVRLMKAYQPRVVITFGKDGISGHPDHKAISTFTTQAFDRVGHPSARLFFLAPSEATLQGCGVEPSRENAVAPVISVDIAPYREIKARAIQCHASQNPPFQGDQEEEADNLVCHEYFTLVSPNESVPDLFKLFGQE
ncbi:MAG: PIG-L deacetylase family protein [Anaerolineales bacterium]|nr:PIG-L deacetylase family protein [Anaerolineales bacterium]